MEVRVGGVKILHRKYILQDLIANIQARIQVLKRADKLIDFINGGLNTDDITFIRKSVYIC